MAEPRRSDERPIKRYDVRDAVVFKQLIVERPWPSLLFALLVSFGGFALAFDWVGTTSNGFGPWPIAALAWLLAMVVAFIAVRAVCRGGSTKKS